VLHDDVLALEVQYVRDSDVLERRGLGTAIHDKASAPGYVGMSIVGDVDFERIDVQILGASFEYGRGGAE
jgi:hypothetical protein